MPQVADEDLRVLANQRAQAAKDYLIETGKVPADRMFLIAPKLAAEEMKDKGNVTRAELSLK
jgi:flagellar motor protein MotB